MQSNRDSTASYRSAAGVSRKAVNSETSLRNVCEMFMVGLPISRKCGECLTTTWVVSGNRITAYAAFRKPLPRNLANPSNRSRLRANKFIMHS
jgi:hypothetical protein